MTEAITNLASGLPVEVGRIDRALKTLWENEAGVVTRASLMNFAIYCEGEQAMRENTELISRFTQNHACRAILIAAQPAAKENRVQAWISAHCHMSRAGAKQVCCEQITFLLEGESRSLIPNIVFSHLDSDLPLSLWWQGEFHSPVDDMLWTWVDRLIYDSRSWKNPKQQFELLRKSLGKIKSRLTLCDLNWVRLLPLRYALAQMFDNPVNLLHLEKINQVRITHASGSRSTAILLTGWLMAQLCWKLTGSRGDSFMFSTPAGVETTVHLAEDSTATIGACHLQTPDASFKVCMENRSEFLHGEVLLPDGRMHPHLLPPMKDDVLTLLNEEFMRGGKHKLYLKALDAVNELF
jgi:glucose-6-phosphate dehydrogenase assembly protein OpcA